MKNAIAITLIMVGVLWAAGRYVYDEGRHKGYRECLSEQDDDFPKPRSNQN